MAKKAFLVGINDYPGSGSDLKGCVNDVTNLRDVLLKYVGFGVKEVRVLTDRRATKANILQRLEWLEGYLRPRFLPPPVDILCRLEEELPIKRLGSSLSPAPANPGKAKLNHLLWAGCRDNQTSADAFIKGSYNGAFTYFLCKHVRDTEGKATRSELLKRLRASLRYEGYEQVPQLEGAAEAKKKPLFG